MLVVEAAHPLPGSTDVFAGPGRYGPYIRRGDDYRSLEPSDNLFVGSRH